jgi:hypothetical protein
VQPAARTVVRELRRVLDGLTVYGDAIRRNGHHVSAYRSNEFDQRLVSTRTIPDGDIPSADSLADHPVFWRANRDGIAALDRLILRYTPEPTRH